MEIKLDLNKLLGFRLANPDATGAKVGDKGGGMPNGVVGLKTGGGDPA